MRFHSARPLLAVILALACAAVAAHQPKAVLKVSGAIGVDPLTAAGGADALNTVRGINPGGRAWVIRKLEGAVFPNASVSVQGKGLLLASGEGIATRGAVTHVAATLTCGAADATALKFSTAPAELDAAGNFSIRGPLLDGANAAVLPVPCSNPLLMIRAANPTTGVPGGWFAVGIPDSDD